MQGRVSQLGGFGLRSPSRETGARSTITTTTGPKPFLEPVSNIEPDPHFCAPGVAHAQKCYEH